MITGYEPAEVRERLALLQITPEILQKPIDGEKLLARLERIQQRLGVPAREVSLTPGEDHRT